MVIFILRLLCLLPLTLIGIETNNVDAEVQWNSIYANRPYTVTLSITHDSRDKIDPLSFTADNKKISPTFVKSVKMEAGSPLEISIYSIEMQGLPQGLQILPTFSVRIKDKIYSSIPTGFQVLGDPQATQNNSIAQPNDSLPTLKLLPIFTGTNPLYPGQRFFLGYRYLYNSSFDLSEEKLPLLEAKGFKKIGDKQIENGIDKGMSATQIVQKVEAEAPGSYTFPPSQIVGYSYKTDSKGQKLYNKKPLSSTLNSFEIKVIPFPEQNKPASFNGAIGDYDFQVKLVSPNQVQVGDKVQLQLAISGSGELDQLLSPDLCCQPGFSGFFKLSDLPPIAKVQGNTKTFLVDLIVENSNALSIPPIEFSYFNPLTKAYGKKVSTGIPLSVSGKEQFKIPNIQKETITSLENQEIKAVSPKADYILPLGLIVLFGIGLIVCQAHYKYQKEEAVKTEAIHSKSKQIFQQAMHEESNPDLFYPLLIQALRQKMWEENQIASQNTPLDQMPKSPLKDLLTQLENNRFSQNGSFDFKNMIPQLKKIFNS